MHNKAFTVRLDSVAFIMGLANILGIVVAVYLPTSKENVIFGVNRLVLVWVFLIIDVLLIRINNAINYRQLIFSMLCINIYMLFVTMLAQIQFNGARVSLARIAPTIALVFLCSLRIRKYPSIKVLKILLNVVTVTAIVWNFAILFNIKSVIDFTYNNYNQYYDLNAYYQVLTGHKPVMSFGVHSYAAYFYFLLFLLCFATYKIENKKMYLFYSIIYTIFNLFLVSTTAIIFFFAMCVFFVKEMWKHMNLKRLFLVFGAVVFIIVLIVANFDMLYSRLYINFTNGGNSFVSRYSSNSVFNTNFKIIASSIGIGYNIVDSLDIGYSDSGYIVYMTMGSLPFTVAVYYLLYKFLRSNLKLYRNIIMFVIFSFEVALPATFNYRFSYMILFVICYMGALSQTLKMDNGENV